MVTIKKHSPFLLKFCILLIVIPLLLPILYLMEYSISNDWYSTSHLLMSKPTLKLLLNTLLLCFIVTSVTIILAICIAFILERCQIRAKSLLSTLISLPLCIPALISSFTWFSLDTSIFSGLFGICFVMVFALFPLAFLPISAGLRRLDGSWEEVSYSLSRNKLYTFWHVILPQLKPAIGNSILLIALHLLVEFGAVSIMGYDTFSTAIFSEFEAYYNTQTAAVLCLVLVILCMIIVGFELKFRGNSKLVRSGKGSSSPPKLIPLNKWEWPAIIFVLSIFIFGVLIPVFMLCAWLYEGTSIHSEYFQFGTYIEAVIDTILISFASAAITLFVALPLVWYSIRYRGFISIWVERLPFLLHAIPAVVIGLAIAKYTVVYAYPLYATYYVLIPAYLMLYLPLAQTSIRTSIEQIPQGIENISNSLGKTGIQLFIKIIIPCIRPGIIAGFALCFLQMMKELTSTLILSPVGMTTMAIELWHAQEGLQYSIVAAYGLSLILFSGIPVFLLKKYISD